MSWEIWDKSVNQDKCGVIPKVAVGPPDSWDRLPSAGSFEGLPSGMFHNCHCPRSFSWLWPVLQLSGCQMRALQFNLTLTHLPGVSVTSGRSRAQSYQTAPMSAIRGVPRWATLLSSWLQIWGFLHPLSGLKIYSNNSTDSKKSLWAQHDSKDTTREQPSEETHRVGGGACDALSRCACPTIFKCSPT